MAAPGDGSLVTLQAGANGLGSAYLCRREPINVYVDVDIDVNAVVNTDVVWKYRIRESRDVKESHWGSNLHVSAPSGPRGSEIHARQSIALAGLGFFNRGSKWKT